MLSITHRHAPGIGSVEVHRERMGSLDHVHLLIHSPRPVGLSVGLTDYQARELCLALLSALCGPDMGELRAILAEAEAGSAGALGKNTDTDSHRGARYERHGDCRLSAEPSLPLVFA
jgi:hypothetical protein